MNNEIIMTTKQVMDFYSLSHVTLKTMRENGLPYIKLGTKNYNYNYEEIERFLNKDGKLYSRERMLVNMKQLRQYTGLDRNRIYREMLDFRLPYYDLQGNKGNNIYRFDLNEVDEWLHDYKERGGKRT